MAKRIIVIDSADPIARENRCFDPVNEYADCGYAINVRLAREARRRGMDVATADVYLAMPNHRARAVCLTDMVTTLTDEVLARGARPAVCKSLESPLFAKHFYHNIVRYAGRYHHNYQFRGTLERLANTGTVFHPIIFPVDTRVPLIPQSWAKRDYLIMVNSNKRAFSHRRGNLKETARSTLSRAKFLAYKVIDPWMRIREVYVDRIEAMFHFSAYTDFRVYGIGWDQGIPGFGAEYTEAARQAWAGPLTYQRKREVMGGFKFALCFENCAFPGYVTEKIFDCWLAGCIPIYLGAPDIVEFVPEHSYIDFRHFANYADLDRFLHGMTEPEANSYLSAAQGFLASTGFDKCTVDYFVNDLVNVLEQELE